MIGKQEKKSLSRASFALPLLAFAAIGCQATPAIYGGERLSAQRVPAPTNVTPAIDVPYAQEFNQLPPLTSPDRVEVVAILDRPASFPLWHDPLLVSPTGFRAGDAQDFVMPTGFGDVVAAAAIEDAIVLASANEVLVIHANAQPVRVAMPTGEIVQHAFSGIAATAIGEDATNSVWIATAERTYRLTRNETQQDILEASAVAYVAHAQGSASQGAASLRCSLTRTQVRCSNASADMLLPTTIGEGRSLVLERTLPTALEVVVVGSTGIAGANGNAWVDVPLFAEGRMPYAGSRTVKAYSDGGFVVATPGGAMRILNRDNGPEWRAYNANRWILSPDVRDVLVQGNTIWLGSSAGLSSVLERTMTLDEKFEAFVERVVQRHDREGAVADSVMSTPGDLSTSIKWDSDNDGFWTSSWVRGECFRYLVTQDPSAKAHFDRSLQAMFELRKQTGLDHFFARSLIRKAGCQLDDCDNPNDGEWFTSPDGQFWVKGDTSNDEFVAHMAMMGTAYDLCADDAQKQGIREHVSAIVGGIVRNGYRLLDRDGLETKYGQWNPEYILSAVVKASDGGQRAAQILAGLTLAHYMTGEARFDEAKRALIRDHGYADLAEVEIDGLLRGPKADLDKSAANAWMILLRYEPDATLLARWRNGWNLLFERKLRIQEVAWAIMLHAYHDGENPPINLAMRWLRQVPTDLIRWNLINSNRRDLVPVETNQRWFESDAKMRSDRRPLPFDERQIERWNTHQFQLDGGHDAKLELDGAEILEHYWMGRYYGWIVPAT